MMLVSYPSPVPPYEPGITPERVLSVRCGTLRPPRRWSSASAAVIWSKLIKQKHSLLRLLLFSPRRPWQ